MQKVDIILNVKYWRGIMEIRLLDKNEIVELNDFVKEVASLDENVNYFLEVNAAFFRDYSCRKCLCYGAFNNENLIAYYLLNLEGVQASEFLAENLQVDIDDLAKSAVISSFLVHPSFRGKGIQNLFTKKAEEEVINQGFLHMLVSINSHNTFARKNLDANKYTYRCTITNCDFYGKPLK